MIIYFADRQMSVKGCASTNLPEGYVISEDLKIEDVETGVASFSCRVGFNAKTRAALEEMTNVGNYLLRSNDDENEFYTIVEAEIDTKNQEVYIYAEDAGLDLLNEIADSFEAAEGHNAEWYINKYIVDSGFVIGINEIPNSTVLTLKWDGEETVTARLASIAEKFGGYEISYSFDIKGLEITNKYVNIHQERGKDAGVTLWLNKDIDKIVTTKSITNLATAFECEGGVKDKEETAITFTSEKYSYDDGDFFVDGNKLKSRKANEKWSRYVWGNEPNQQAEFGGYIVRPFSFDTTEAETLCSQAIAELKKVCDMEVNYEIAINKLPKGVKIGDRINIVDEAGELYVSSRVLQIEVSVADRKHSVIVGEHLIRSNGISAKVAALAEQFAYEAKTAERALKLANDANKNVDEAKKQAEQAAKDAEEAQKAADEANKAAQDAEKSATDAAGAAKDAQDAVDRVAQSVSGIEQTVQNAHEAAANAAKAAEIAQRKAEEAEAAAKNAQADAEDAESAAEDAKEAAEGAKVNTAEALTAADIAKEKAKEAIETARAAKLDAEQAERDVASFAENLETITDTLEEDFARKTDLTDTTAHLQSQISRNAAKLNSKVALLQTIDETANDAREKSDAAQLAAEEAQTNAAKAEQDAQRAENAATTATQAALDAHNEANIAQAAAENARSVADKAEADLEAAIADLATLQARAEATEEEIANAQAAVDAAQIAATNAKAEADAAATQAAEAQDTASEAVAEAWKTQLKAESARKEADRAAQLAELLLGDWESAKTEAEAAQSKAAQALETATEAKGRAEAVQSLANSTAQAAKEAQATADEAAETAKRAQATATEAELLAAEARSNLENAEARLEEVLLNNPTDEEIQTALDDVTRATEAASAAELAATSARTAADEAQSAATEAQQAAETARTEADTARAAADEAQAEADEAQAAVDGLAVRVTKAETNITQGAKNLEFQVSEVLKETTANGKRITEAESLIRMLSDSISMLVRDENGESLMTQTSNGWAFNMSSLQNAIDSASKGLGELQEAAGSTDATINRLQKAVEDLGTLSEYILIATDVYKDEDGMWQEEPAILLGENDTGFKLKITNTRIVFTDGSNDLVSINSKKKALEIEKAEIKGELQIGDDEAEGVHGVWVWQQRSNGNLGLVWKEVAE